MRLRTVCAATAGLALAATGDAQAAKQNQDATCGNTTISLSFDDTLYAAVNNNGEGKIGPRRLVVNQSGRIFSRSTRLFKGYTPWDIDQAEVKIKKTAGKGRTTVAICATEAGSNAPQRVLRTFEIPNGKDSIGRTFTHNLTGLRDKRLSVYFKGKSVANSMSYTMTVERPNAGEIWEPSAQQLNGTYQSVEGFADLHAHHAGRWAFAGGWFFGPMEGELPPDPADHSRALQVNLPGLAPAVIRAAHANQTLPKWSDTSHQQINSNALKGAHDNGLGLMVAPAVNSEWLCAILTFMGETEKTQSCNDMESAKKQILEMKRFDEDHDWYKIVTNPWEARQAADNGQLAVVLAVEVSDILPTSDGDWKRQLDELYDMGVRMVYLAHESNSRFAGASYHHTETLALPNKLTAWFSRDIKYASKDGGKRNAIGLTSTGQDLVRELMRRHMVIDVDHTSWKAAEGIARITSRANYYPIYAGHTRINGLMTAAQKELTPELNTPPKVFENIRESGGMIGMRTGPEALRRYDDSGVPNNCDGSSKSLIQTYRNIVDRGVPAAFGSDLNGFVPTEIGRAHV